MLFVPSVQRREIPTKLKEGAISLSYGTCSSDKEQGARLVPRHATVVRLARLVFCPLVPACGALAHSGNA